MKELFEKLTEDFKDGEYAHAYMESHAVYRLAAQVHALRKQRGWTQRQLAEKSGIAQERISKIESADFSSLTMSTLNKFARAFDVDLSICFQSFTKGILDVANLSSDQLKVEEREADLESLCRMNYVLRGDGNILIYDVPQGVSVITQSQELSMDQLMPDMEWQALGDAIQPEIRVAQGC
jgi:transcriptional regulator with XRE-family HTH domain